MAVERVAAAREAATVEAKGAEGTGEGTGAEVKAWGIPHEDVFAHLHVLRRREDGGVALLDSRDGTRREHDLGPLAHAVLEAADRPVTEAALQESLGRAHPAAAIAAALAELEALDLVIREDDKLLSLVLPRAPATEGSYRTGVTLPERAPQPA